LQICFTSSSVISGLFVVFMIYLFDMKLKSPAIFENLIRKSEAMASLFILVVGIGYVRVRHL
ncbi:MAG TPA: hypothetical protein VFC84_04825, partial [Desulfosporosinus sp.]|nr:hypothetical protein [Desulfosporosinus sp.]